jgi:hypothetical protein
MLRTHPSYAALQTPFVERTWHDVQLKIDHPGMDMARAFPPGTHQSNLTYRMIPPALAHLFGLRRTGMLLLSALAGLLLLYFVLAISAAEGGSPFAAVMICLATACAWPGRTAFHELRGGYYDAFALCLVLAAYASRSPILSGGLLFLGAWTDERALIAASFLALSGRIWPLAGAAAAYAVTRIAMA